MWEVASHVSLVHYYYFIINIIIDKKGEGGTNTFSDLLRCFCFLAFSWALRIATFWQWPSHSVAFDAVWLRHVEIGPRVTVFGYTQMARAELRLSLHSEHGYPRNSRSYSRPQVLNVSPRNRVRRWCVNGPSVYLGGHRHEFSFSAVMQTLRELFIQASFPSYFLSER